MPDAVIAIDDLSKTYASGFEALKHASLEIERGEADGRRLTGEGLRPDQAGRRRVGDVRTRLVGPGRRDALDGALSGHSRFLRFGLISPDRRW